MTLLQQAARSKGTIASYFFWFDILLFAITLFGAWSIISDQPTFMLFYYIGRNAGQVALLLFCLSITPGIFRRFGITSEPVQLLMLYRRQIGVLMFMVALMHYIWVFLAPTIASGIIPTTVPPYIVMGILSLYLLILLFATSNNFMVKKLGKWWGRIHKLVYLIVWLIFAHVVLIDVSIWSAIIGIFAILEIISLVKAGLKKKTTPTIPQS